MDIGPSHGSDHRKKKERRVPRSAECVPWCIHILPFLIALQTRNGTGFYCSVHQYDATRPARSAPLGSARRVVCSPCWSRRRFWIVTIKTKAKTQRDAACWRLREVSLFLFKFCLFFFNSQRRPRRIDGRWCACIILHRETRRDLDNTFQFSYYCLAALCQWERKKLVRKIKEREQFIVIFKRNIKDTKHFLIIERVW